MVRDRLTPSRDADGDATAFADGDEATATADSVLLPPVARLVFTRSAALVAPTGETARVIPWRRFGARISYSACNEDSGSEIEVLRPGRAKRIVCISAGGGRVLNLLEEGADEVWAVDVNPPQTHLLELKIAATRSLQHATYLEFLGVRPSSRRLDVYDSLRPQLSQEARAYFDARPGIVERGALYQGSLERFFARYIAPITHLVGGRWIDRLFACTTLAEQTRLLPSWNTPLFRLVGQTLCRRAFFRLFSRDPGFWRFVPPEVKLHQRIFELLHHYLERHLARDNHLLWLVFHGRYGDERVMPRYLLPGPFERIKATLAEVQFHVVRGELGRVLGEAPAEHFDAYSISDISSYLTQQACDETIEQVLRTARSGAQLCSRGIFCHRPLAREHQRRLVRDQALERRLEQDDHAMVHAFLAAEIR
jgi:S-adenosylmethionine-diacylglycerol 3-amino-3-carboxypropyl transferase